MKKIPIQEFAKLMNLPKRVALRKLYADFDVRLKADRKRCNKAWELLSNAFIERNSKSEYRVKPGDMADSGLVGNTKTTIQSGGIPETNGKEACST